MSFDKETAKKEIKLLIEKLKKIENTKKYNEEMTKKDFILPLFRALGWNVEDSSEVTAEEKISKTRVDYSFRINGIPKFFLEAKALDVDLNKEEYIQQAINYAWHKGCTWAILTNFKSILIFNAEWVSLNPFLAHFKSSTYDEFIKDFDDVLWLLSKESFENGIIDKVAEKYGKKAKKLPIDKQLLSDFTRFRELLSKNIFKNNKDKGLTEDDVDESVQRILDRLIFIRNCEDRELEPKKLISAIRESKDRDNLIKYIRDIFSGFDKDYNSKIFAPHLCDELFIDKDVLIEIIEGLYHTKDKTIEYDFSAIEADVLGNIYEQYLGHILRKSEKRSQIKESYKKRKEQGIYYTPTYIVDYIVKNTLGEVLKNKKLEEVEKIRVLDPACGSGSFLIKAFDVLNEYYKKNDKKYSQIKLDLENGDTYTRKVGILKNNIFGVDIDKQAVEIAQLNLLLKIAEKGHRLPLLQDNIKCGNSLVDDKEVAGDKAYKWEEEFKEIMEEGGFDVIIGNPPWVFTRSQKIKDNEKLFFYEKYKLQEYQLNTYGLFIEKSYFLLKQNGILGFIVPNNWLTVDSCKNLRKFLIENTGSLHIINIYDKVFEDANINSSILIFKKHKHHNVYLYEINDKNIKFITKVKNIEIKENDYIINIQLLKNKNHFNILKKIESSSNQLKYFCNVSTGLKAYQVGKGNPKQTSEIVNKRIFHSKSKLSKEYLPYLEGRDVNRYFLSWSGEYLKYGDFLAEPRKSVPFKGKRILIRQIPSKPPYCLNSVLIDKEVLHDINSMVLFNFVKYDPKIILGIINSKLLSYWFIYKFGKLQRNLFPQFKVKELKQFPIIKEINEKNKNKLVSLVDKMLLLHNKLNELENKKTDEYYKIQNEISKTDNEIDQLVYGIYNITEVEQKIIDESLNQN